jgi:predicted nucleotidyltransferase
MTEQQTDEPNVDLGDGEWAQANTILRTEVGSGVHGMAIAGTDDHDESGVYVERMETVLGLHEFEQYQVTKDRHRDHYVYRTQPQGARSGPGDVDLTLYELGKFLRLALAGNPTILVPLFAPQESVYACDDHGALLRALAPEMLSWRTVERFLGYLDNQRERMLGGGKQNRVPNRPELIEAHGYDTKYASHALRLACQGVQVAHEQTLTLPMPTEDLRSCMEVKRGEVPFEEALRRIDECRSLLQSILDDRDGDLPEEPDYAMFSQVMIDIQRKHWGI